MSVNLPTGSGKSLIFGVTKSRNGRMLQCCNARKLKAGILKSGSTKIEHRTAKGWFKADSVCSALIDVFLLFTEGQRSVTSLFPLSDFLLSISVFLVVFLV